MVDRMHDGVIYGQPPSKLPDVPDIAGMFEAADIPKTDGSARPHSLEWYADAPNRQKKRDEETALLIIDRNDFRNEWCAEAKESMMTWIDKVESLANLQEPQDINELLARTVHQRASDTEEIQKLKSIMANAEEQRARLREENANVIERLRILDEKISEKNAADQAEEEERQEKERLIREYKAKSEEALRKAQQMMYGEEEDGAEEGTLSEGDAEEEVGGGPLPPLKSPSPSPEKSLLFPDLSPDPLAATPSARSGKGRELPPLSSPPPPPALDD